MPSKSSSERYARKVEEFRKQPETDNETCADCEVERSTWANVTAGVFVCMSCAGVHRKLPSCRVMSLTMDDWTKADVESLTSKGAGAPLVQLESYVRRKYESGKMARAWQKEKERAEKRKARAASQEHRPPPPPEDSASVNIQPTWKLSQSTIDSQMPPAPVSTQPAPQVQQQPVPVQQQAVPVQQQPVQQQTPLQMVSMPQMQVQSQPALQMLPQVSFQQPMGMTMSMAPLSMPMQPSFQTMQPQYMCYPQPQQIQQQQQPMMFIQQQQQQQQPMMMAQQQPQMFYQQMPQQMSYPAYPAAMGQPQQFFYQ